MGNVAVMGILNITPDSFSDGGTFYNNIDAAVERARIMLTEGADWIDIGGESTRPGAPFVSAEEEAERVIPVIQALRQHIGFHFDISIDTYKAQVAEQAIRAGATIVNSLGGFIFDELLADVVSASGCRIVIYHIKGTPQTMQQGPIVYNDVIDEITAFFEAQIAIGLRKGVQKKQFILDPGVGFGKTVHHNVEIIKRFHAFQRFELPLLIGVSRKGHLGTLLKEKMDLPHSPAPTERLEAALAETAIAVLHGATIVRTHDVMQTARFLRILEEFI